ncbi:hypothetical protein DASC09_019400 [Saccharomycopsis crataegensis]|uniref:Uncharacterized protein n=1 Tax=Saccharomycopsis crataegensis TaxID=43959 RepID=A0AAV5QI50_9ASCO|nr:hypothetical protein DASC09_019400 [Saccharomycopsis crataegensis]
MFEYGEKHHYIPAFKKSKKSIVSYYHTPVLNPKEDRRTELEMHEYPEILDSRYQRLIDQLEELLSFHIFRGVYNRSDDYIIPSNESSIKFVDATGFDIALRTILFAPWACFPGYFFERQINNLGFHLEETIKDNEIRFSDTDQSVYIPLGSFDEASNSLNFHKCVLNSICRVIRALFPTFNVERRCNDFVYRSGPNSIPVFPIKMASPNISQVHLLASCGFVGISKEELKKIGNQQIPKIEKDQRPRPATSAWESTNIVCAPEYLSILEADEGKVFCMKKLEFIGCIDAK